ncbi:heterokaryon incompatibility protein-domain-containing protein [Xylaria arbuscula]|nr:heterokaryon incompatibility protein-domain-containing protein [Xylaria arbuscula]
MALVPYTYQSTNDANVQNYWQYFVTEPKIRLLTLLPGTRSQPLECSLQTLNPFPQTIMHLSDIPNEPSQPYEALSYCWGDSTEKEHVIYDGKALEITSSLAEALRAVRLVDQARVLWADGVCINQSDDNDKGEQVVRMAAIYASAKQVLCWFGNDEGNHAKHTFDLAIRLSQKLAPHLDNKPSSAGLSTPTGTTVYIDHALSIAPKFSDEELEQELKEGSNLEHIRLFFEKPWFSRMWIRQEIGFASKALAMCGDSQLDWNALDYFQTWAIYRGYQIGAAAGFCKTRTQLGSFRETQDSFLHLLFNSRNFKCSDPRDKVFALLAHASAYDEVDRLPGKDHVADVARAISANKDVHTIATTKAKSYLDITSEINSLSHAVAKLNPPGSLLGDIARLGIEVTRSAISVMNKATTRASSSSYNAPRDLGKSEAESSEFSYSGDQSDGDKSGQESDRGTRMLSIKRRLFEHSDSVDTAKLSAQWSDFDKPPDSTANSDRQTEGGGNNLVDKNDGPVDDETVTAFSLLSQVRRLSEIENPNLHPVNRLSLSYQMATVFSRPIIKVDYSKSKDEIYLEVARNLVLRTESLELLSAVEHRSSEFTLNSANPSWVPAWDRPMVSRSLGVKPMGKFCPWLSTSQKPSIKIEGNVLTCPGIAVDVILSSTYPVTMQTLLKDSSALIQFWLTIFSWDLSSRYPMPLQRFHTYLKVFTADNHSLFPLELLNVGPGKQQVLEGFAAYWHTFYDATKAIRRSLLHDSDSTSSIPWFFPVPELDEAAKRGDLFDFVSSTLSILRGRRVFYTKNGLLGIGPEALQPDDVVCILPSEVPFVMRSTNDHHILVGECYLDGIMNGECMDDSKIFSFNIH